MFVESLSIVNYKNIGEAEIKFSPRLNCFVGGNGAGKTNFFDAIYFLCCCKSRTNAIDKDNIKHDADFFMLQGDFMRNGVTEHITVGLKRGKHKSFKRNGKEYGKLQLHIGLLPAVMVSPDDSVLIAGGSEERRKFADGVISQYDPVYLDNLLRYNRLLMQRNSMLKDGCSDNELFEVCEMQMADLADYIYEGRVRFLEKLSPLFNHFYEKLCSGSERVAFRYRSHLQNGSLLPQMQATRERDKIIGFSTKGIHKDDFEMFLNDYPLKKNGSQGQSKSFLVALKLAQYEMLKHAGNLKPILLLDDIFDKLDAGRVEKIINLVSGDDFGQIFITDTNRQHIDLLLQNSGAEYALFNVAQGEIAKIQ